MHGIYLLGVDLGTSACKVALFSETGELVRQTSEGYPVFYPRPGWAEQSPEDWWKAVACAIRRVLEGVSPTAIAGVGVDGQSWSAISIDRHGLSMGNTPIWMDTRAADICRRLDAQGLGERCFQISGNPLKPCYTLPKILWLRQEASDIYRHASKVLQSNGWIVYRLTGQITQDLSQGYGYGCFDMRRGCWDLSACRAFGISESLLPPLADCHAVVGYVHREASLATGLAEGTPVVAGGLDAACATLGAGVCEHGQTQEQGGQAGGMSIAMDHMVAERRLILSRHVVPGLWLLQGGTVGGGGAIRWLSEALYPEPRAHDTVFEEMSLLAEKAPAGSNGLLFLPYMAGERSPIWDEHAKGVYFGLSYQTERTHLIRACMEGVAYSLEHNLRIAKEVGVSVALLRAMGGSANSVPFTQIKSDVTGLPIEVPSSDTATTLGVCMLAGVGVGVYPDFRTAVRRTVHIGRTHVPNEDNASIYEQGYERYRALYERLKSLMKEGDVQCIK